MEFKRRYQTNDGGTMEESRYLDARALEDHVNVSSALLTEIKAAVPRWRHPYNMSD